jgi:RNA polymerase sigma-70 factor (ECF subfamily)
VQAELVARARQGDHDAFEQIARSAVGRLYGTASVILRDREAAADAVQETLIAAWRNLPLLRDPEAFDGWLSRILIRNCYRAVRSRRRVLEMHVKEIDAPVRSQEDRVGTMDQIDRAFSRLSPDHRAVLVLHHRLGLELQEAADTLGIPVGTAKSRLHRATSAFRAAFEAEDREAILIRGQTA